MSSSSCYTLKSVAPGINKHAVGLWSKSLDKVVNEENPTYPYLITSVEQIAPSREHMEMFETKRNQLDKVMPAGKKLETINLFYNPSSEGLLKKLLHLDWRETFVHQLDSLVLYSNAQEAIQSQEIPFYRLIISRVCLGREGVDYTQPKPGQYKIKDLSSVTSSFLYSFRNVLFPDQQQLNPLGNSSSTLSPLKSSTSSIPSSPSSTTTTTTTSSVTSTPPKPRHASEKLVGDGLLCPSCQKENAGNTKYCIRCGGHL